jgi:ceramide glucosyltransferase
VLNAFLILAALVALQSLVALRDGYRFLRLVRRSRREPPGDYVPPAAVIIPCKGTAPDFEANITRYLSQDFPSYQVVFVVASEQDPAHPFLSKRLSSDMAVDSSGCLKTALVVAGYSDERGEKVNNLLRGLEAVDPAVEVLVFADADARPGRDWLRSLVAPLGDPKVTVSTGFRWYLPGTGFVSQLRAAWDTSIATMLGEHQHNFAWGGSMAIRVEDFRRLEVAKRYWARTASDDYALTRAVRQAGGWIRFEPRCLVASQEQSSFAEFLRWSNRQIIITRVYAAHLWWMGLASYLLYCGTILYGLGLLTFSGFSAPGRAGIAAFLILILLPGIAKGHIRTLVARELFGKESVSLGRYGARYWQLAPLVPWVMLWNFLTAGLTRHIEWRGTHYHLLSKDELRVLRRDGV